MRFGLGFPSQRWPRAQNQDLLVGQLAGVAEGFWSPKPNHQGLASALLCLHGVCLLGSSQELTLRPRV